MKFRYLLEADKGGGTGAGGDATGDVKQTVVDPFAGIDLENLSVEDQEKITKAKETFATLQTKAADADKYDKLARQHQSEKDRMAAELQKLQQGHQQQQQQKELTPTQQVEADLIADGVDPKVAAAQAPIMANMLRKHGDRIKQEMGQGFAPIANMVLHNEAESAFRMVDANDNTGAMQIAEVRDAVWKSANEMAAEGTRVTEAVVDNLVGMHTRHYLKANNQ